MKGGVMTAIEKAQELIELITDEAMTCNEIERRIIANRITEVLDRWHKRTSTAIAEMVEPFNDGEARFYGGNKMPFGKYAGERVDSVPLGYLIWLADESRTTWRGLHRYLNSPRIKQELDDLES
jgi:hypothetical protein